MPELDDLSEWDTRAVVNNNAIHVFSKNPKYYKIPITEAGGLLAMDQDE
jgi:hypothetical protein